LTLGCIKLLLSSWAASGSSPKMEGQDARSLQQRLLACACCCSLWCDLSCATPLLQPCFIIRRLQFTQSELHLVKACHSLHYNPRHVEGSNSTLLNCCIGDACIASFGVVSGPVLHVCVVDSMLVALWPRLSWVRSSLSRCNPAVKRAGTTHTARCLPAVMYQVVVVASWSCLC